MQVVRGTRVLGLHVEDRVLRRVGNDPAIGSGVLCELPNSPQYERDNSQLRNLRTTGLQ